MIEIRKSTSAAIAGFGALALLAMPALAGGADISGAGQLQMAHMSGGQDSDRSNSTGMMKGGHGMHRGDDNGHGMGMAPGTMDGTMPMMGQGDGERHGADMRRDMEMAPGMMKGAMPMMGPVVDMGDCSGHAVKAGGTIGADEVRTSLEKSLAWHGNKRLKVGGVTETKDGAIVAEIVTVDGSLVQRFAVDRATGRMRQID